MAITYKGLQVWVTGASAGIGAAFAKELHSRGAQLTLIARREDRLSALCESFNKIRPNSARYIACDLTQHHSQAFQELEHQLSTEQVDLLINNAGKGTFGSFSDLPCNGEIEMIDLNIISYLRLTHAVLPQMKEKKQGYLINLSSIAGLAPLPLCATYAASKAFIFSHSVSLSNELSSYGIKVLALCPGPTDSEFTEVAGIPGTITGLRADNVSLVVSKALRALETGKLWTTPGFLSSLLAYSSLITPLCIGVKISGWITRRSMKRRGSS